MQWRSIWIVGALCLSVPIAGFADSGSPKNFDDPEQPASGLSVPSAQIDNKQRSKDASQKLNQLLNEKPPLGTSGESNSFKGMRAKAIREAAYTYAVQTAAKLRYESIASDLKEVTLQLDRVFDFSALTMVHGRVLPPVITHGRQGWRKIDDRTAQAVKQEFKILSPARIITATPTWRSYLLKSYPGGDKPNSVLYPKNGAERKIWRSAIRSGWDSGRKLAMQLYQSNLNRLKRDFVGMIMFHRLANENMVSLPSTAQTEPRIKVNGETLSVGKHVFRITLPSEWKRTGAWTPGAALDE